MEPLNQPAEQPESSSGPQSNAVAFCRACGKALSQDAVQLAAGTIYCAEHAPRTATPPPPASEWSPAAVATAPPPPAAGANGISPGLAFVLGLIPGVGAIYNGQYAKGFVHVLITGVLFSLAGGDSGAMEPMFEMFSFVWFFYMAFEAYHTAKKRQRGEAVDEFSSIFPNQAGSRGFPILPVLLIVLGVLFLLNNLDILKLRMLVPYIGPLFLIGLGVYLLWVRMRSNAALEVSHERN